MPWRPHLTAEGFELSANFVQLAPELFKFLPRTCGFGAATACTLFEFATRFLGPMLHFHGQVRHPGGAQVFHRDMQVIEPLLQFDDGPVLAGTLTLWSAWSIAVWAIGSLTGDFFDLTFHPFGLLVFAVTMKVSGVFPHLIQLAFTLRIAETFTRPFVTIPHHDASLDHDFFARRSVVRCLVPFEVGISGTRRVQKKRCHEDQAGAPAV